MSVSAWMRRIALTAATTTLVSAPLPALGAVAAPAGPQTPEQSPLLDRVPTLIRSSCTSVIDEFQADTTLPTGMVDAVACPVDTPSGETVVIYVAFRDSAAMQAAFTSEIPASPGQGNCSDGNPGQGSYDQGSAQNVGEWACFTTSDSNREIAWTHEPSRTLAVLVDPQLDFAALDKLWYELVPIA